MTQVAYVDRVRCRFFGPEYVRSVVWLNDSVNPGFAQLQQRARGRQCAACADGKGLPPAAEAAAGAGQRGLRRRAGDKEGEAEGERARAEPPAGAALFSDAK